MPRRALVVAGLAALALTPSLAAPPAEAVSRSYPVLSRGSQGTDVRVLQYLLRAQGYPIKADGAYGSTTVDAVRAFQLANGLDGTGVATTSTWARVVIPLASGSSGSAVKALQLALNHKHDAGLNVTGTFGRATRAAVSAFQRQTSITATGVVDRQTWRTLVWHFEQPRFAAASLCSYSNPPNYDRAHWGTSETVAGLERAAVRVYAAGYGPVAVGDISRTHGGDISGHTYHEQGLDADLRPMRDANNQCSRGVTWYRWSGGRKVCCNPAYDRTATRALIRALRAASPGHVHFIWFNDPKLIAEGLTRYHAGHDDHLHVSYCELWHPVPFYIC